MTTARNSSIWYVVFLAITTYLFNSPTHAQYGGGSGEPNDPYLIYTAEQMNEIGLHEYDWDKHFKLMADIDLGGFMGTGFNIIGTGDDNPFIGVFNGNDHTISNFSCDCNGVSYIGLFGNVGYADRRGNPQIRDLGLIDSNVDTKTGRYVGSLVGHLRHGNITGCYAEGGRVSGSGNVGGLVGRIWWGTITNCYSLANVTGGGDVAGLVGYNYGGTVVSCFSNGNVTGNRCVGGLVGWNNFFGEIVNCYAAGDITGNEYVGGLVGRNLIRKNRPGRITNCYSVGRVTGTAYVGGLVGSNWGTVEFSFWDMENSRQTTSNGATGKTTAEMQTASTFLDAGWDFVDDMENGTDDIWWILEGRHYPRLWWQYGRAFSPYPQDGAVDVPHLLTLSWSPGGSGLHHDVYFGEEKETVANATTKSPEIYRGRQPIEMTTYDSSNLELVKTYYWRIDEVNQADPNSPWKSDVWCFTTANFIVVDDFESYDAVDNQIWYSWRDGYGYGKLGVEPYYPGNGTGSLVGEMDWIEETIAHSGCQSMPYEYYNNRPDRLKYSEANLTLSYPRNWTVDGVSELSLWFRGRPADVGSFVEGPVGTYTMTGSGTDIGNRSDQFHFAYKTLTGPGSIVAKVKSIQNTHEWAKAGVMIREELYGYSKHTFVYVTPNNGITFQGCVEWGKTSFSTNQTSITAPHWIKLERDAANNFTAYHSSDGSEWEAIGEMQNIQMDPNIYVGFALTSHDSSVACEAKFSNVTMTGVVGAQWTHQDIGMITNEIEPMYVFIANNTGEPAVVNHNDPYAAGINTWTEWVIPLQTFADQGIDLTDVNSIAIGFGDRNNPQPGGRGKMYFDDIRLYPPAPEPGEN